MKRIGIILILMVLPLLFGNCKQNTFNTESELWSYVRDVKHGYSHEKIIGNVVYTLTYRPTDILVNQQLTSNDNKEEIEKLRNKYQDYIYFNLSISANNQELLNSMTFNRTAFGSMVNQLAFGMGDKIHLISKKRDTIPLIDYTYPRMYGMTNSTDLLLVYPKDTRLKESDYFLITIEDIGFSTGEIGFKIPTRILREEPKLNFKNTL